MRLLKRNCVEFTYEHYLGASDYDPETETYSGEPEPQYGGGGTYRGNLSVPSGFAQNTLFGVNTQYTHVILMDDVNADIQESGRITIGNDTYEVIAVRKSLNVISIAVRQMTRTERL